MEACLDPAAVYAAAVRGLPVPGATAASFDPVTGALYLVFAHPRKAVQRVASSRDVSTPGFSARVDVDRQGRALQMEVRPQKGPFDGRG